MRRRVGIRPWHGSDHAMPWFRPWHGSDHAMVQTMPWSTTHLGPPRDRPYPAFAPCKHAAGRHAHARAASPPAASGTRSPSPVDGAGPHRLHAGPPHPPAQLASGPTPNGRRLAGPLPMPPLVAACWPRLVQPPAAPADSAGALREASGAGAGAQRTVRSSRQRRRRAAESPSESLSTIRVIIDHPSHYRPSESLSTIRVIIDHPSHYRPADPSCNGCPARCRGGPAEPARRGRRSAVKPCS